jgi:hypothetical protein
MFAPRGIRNNNFGNIEDGPFARGLPGYQGSDGRFAQFASADDGVNAMNQLLSSYGRKGVNSINGVINRWAPANDGNNVSSYANNVSQFAGIDPNDQIDLSDPVVRAKVAQGMARHENGPDAYGVIGGLNWGGGTSGPNPGSVDATSYAGTSPAAPQAQPRSAGNFGPAKTIFAGKRDAAADPEGFLPGGPGGLIGLPNGMTSGGYDVAGALQGAGAGLASISSPQQAAALAAVNKPNDDQWQMTVNPATGAVLRINKKNGSVQAVTGAIPAKSKFDDAYDSEQAKKLSDQRAALSDSATKAQQSNSQLDQLGTALSAPGVYQGAGGESVLALKKVAQAVGFNIEGIPEAELANKISKQMALELRDPTGGAGMPGALSDSDRVYLTQMTASLANSPEGNKQIIQMYKSLNQRSIDIDNLASQYEAEHGGRLDAGFRKAVAEYATQHPLFKQQANTSGGNTNLKQKYGLE